MLGPIRRQTSPHAARLRKEKTDCEQRFWLAVRNRRLGGFKFRFQHTVEARIADFACLEAMLIVEIDGSQHGSAADNARTAMLMTKGFEVLRFWNSDIIQNMDGVLETVLARCEARRVR
jgi:very-short-patch-repair endonuclease